MTAPAELAVAAAGVDATSQAELASVLALLRAQSTVRANLTRQAAAMASSAAQGFTGWYDSAAITAWSANLAAQIGTLQTVAAQSTDAYMSRVLSLLSGESVMPLGAVDVSNLRTGVTPAGAYGRAADVYRYQQSLFDQSARDLAQLSDPPALVSPVAAATARAGAVASMDVHLATRAQSHANIAAAASKGLVTGYRRVIHPELARGGTCGLCIAASDRLYGVRKPLPIHQDCHCESVPVMDGKDPGSTLNAADLRRLYQTIGSTDGRKLKATRYQIDENGEWGPALTAHGTPYRSPAQIARDRNRPVRAKSPAEKAEQVRRVRESLAKSLPRAQQLAKDDPKKWGHYLTQLETRIKGLDQQLAA